MLHLVCECQPLQTQHFFIFLFASFGMWLLIRLFANLRYSYSMKHLLSSLLLVFLAGYFGFQVSARQLSAESVRGARFQAPDQLWHGRWLTHYMALAQTVWRHKWKALICWISRQFGAACGASWLSCQTVWSEESRLVSGQGIPQRRKIGDTESDLFDAKNVEGFLRVFFSFFF